MTFVMNGPGKPGDDPLQPPPTPVEEPEPERLPDEDPNPNPDEADRPPLKTAPR